MRMKIQPGGIAICLYTERILLQKLGTLQIERASNVEYDNQEHAWTVTLSDGQRFSQTYQTREDALKAEVRYLEARL